MTLAQPPHAGPPKMKKPTISDVAARAGVAKSTVSAVLNHKNTIRDSTRRTVLRAMDELNYRPSRSAQRGFRPVSSRSICFIVKEAHNPYYAEAMQGIQDVARETGCLIFESSSDGDYEQEHRIVAQCMEREFDGLIITPIRTDESDMSHLFELKRHRIPFVLLESVLGLRASLVDVDNVKASADAVSYLMQLGHTRIVHFAGPLYSEHSRERAEGLRRAYSESHLVFDDAMVIAVGASPEDGYRAGMEYFRERKEERPTAVTCYNDLVALGLLKALRELQIDVPGEVSVVGFDDIRMLDVFPVGLTTVRMPKYEMGKRAAELLMRQIDSDVEEAPERIVLDAELVVRDSTGAPIAP
jgi:LacI family transcriptional regulator/LacI family repressor for deo operon, udp, cdd, tsx, nupC, and nupG